MWRFARHYNLDWQDFLKNGISDKKLLATKDSLALNLVTAVKAEREHNGRRQEADNRLSVLHGDPRDPLSRSD